jgi:hypothetical protein
MIMAPPVRCADDVTAGRRPARVAATIGTLAAEWHALRRRFPHHGDAGSFGAMSEHPIPLRSPVHEITLPNGLIALICEDRRAPVVAVVTHVRAGYFDESDDVVGISHVLEHMFFKGTARRAPGDIARETKHLGGYLNAGTIYDRTSYYTVVPSSGLEQALDLQADALCNAAIEAGELERERHRAGSETQARFATGGVPRDAVRDHVRRSPHPALAHRHGKRSVPAHA